MEQVSKPLALGPDWDPNPGADDSEIELLLRRFPLPFPEEFIRLLRESNGGEGELRLWPGWFVLDAIETIIETNQASRAAGSTPLFFFGGNGGLEQMAFDTRALGPWPVVALDPVAGEGSLRLVAETFEAFLENVGYPGPKTDE